MTVTLSPELQQALDAQPEAPVRVTDPRTNANYVLLTLEQYERIKPFFEAEERPLSALYPLMEESALRAGWDNPEMDVYNDYDAHRPKP